MNDRSPLEEISRKVARLKAGVLALVGALLCGGVVFAMTAWLLIKGGENVGQHLQLLSNYFVGYSVTWKGSVIGFCYGVVVGGVTGWMIGTIYNRIVGMRQQ